MVKVVYAEIKSWTEKIAGAHTGLVRRVANSLRKNSPALRVGNISCILLRSSPYLDVSSSVNFWRKLFMKNQKNIQF